jgi:hypothetical protein
MENGLVIGLLILEPLLLEDYNLLRMNNNEKPFMLNYQLKEQTKNLLVMVL